MLRLRSVYKSYEVSGVPVPVLKGVDLDVEPGRSVALMGESGSGKSTLLHLVGGLDVPDSGEIWISDKRVSVPGDAARAMLRRDTFGIVFQQFNLIPSLTVGANIAFQARLAQRHDAAWCQELAQRMDLTTHLEKYPEVLSGGQQQRVAIARALASRPKVILADEPTGNLDETTADIVMDLLTDLTQQTGTALLMVTHSARHAAKLDAQVRLRAGIIVP